MSITKNNCDYCEKPFDAGRVDQKYCTEKCRKAALREVATFETPMIPRSGVEGITYSRAKRTWAITIPDDSGNRKYVGSRRTLSEAIAFQTEVLGCAPTRVRLTTDEIVEMLARFKEYTDGVSKAFIRFSTAVKEANVAFTELNNAMRDAKTKVSTQQKLEQKRDQ